jgi:hypothetical protein
VAAIVRFHPRLSEGVVFVMRICCALVPNTPVAVWQLKDRVRAVIETTGLDIEVPEAFTISPLNTGVGAILNAAICPRQLYPLATVALVE